MVDNETKNVIIHNVIMVSITLFFVFYFGAVKNSQELQDQIDDNIFVVPVGQILAYEGYVGYVILKQIRRIQQKKKLKRTLSNAITLGGHMFHEYATQVVDLIAITIITFGFFIYGYPNASPDAFEIMNISDSYFLIFVPSIGIITHKILYKRKLAYR